MFIPLYFFFVSDYKYHLVELLVIVIDQEHLLSFEDFFI